MAFKSIPATVFAHWSEFPADLWRWHNFTPQEMACKGDGSLLIHGPSMDLLQRLRNRVAAPMVIHSAFRTRDYNARVGGAAGSMHLAARAYDVSMHGHDPHEFEAMARDVGFTGFGFYPEANHWFIHVDTGPARWWGTPFPFGEDDPSPAPAFVAKPRPAPDQDAAKETILDDLASVFGRGPKISHPLKRKHA